MKWEVFVLEMYEYSCMIEVVDPHALLFGFFIAKCAERASHLLKN